MKRVIGFLIVIGLLLAPVGAFAASIATATVTTVVVPVLELNMWAYESTPIADTMGVMYAPGPERPDVCKEMPNPSMLNFGTLSKLVVRGKDYGIYIPNKAFLVSLAASTSGRKYVIKQSCTSFKNAANNDLSQTLLLTTGYSKDDEFKSGGVSFGAQGELEAGDEVKDINQPKFAVNQSPITIFTSNSGKSRIVRCWYGIATGNNKDTNITPGGNVSPFTLKAEPYDASDKTKCSKPITGDTLSGAYVGVITYTVELL